MTSKAEIINDAFSQLKISGITVNPTPEDVALGLFRLENMAAEFEKSNICLSYAFEDIPNPSTESGVDKGYIHALASNLAWRMVPDFGKDVMSTQALKSQADQSLSTLYSATAAVNQSRYPDRQPMGSGNTFRWNRWRRFYREGAQPVISCDTEMMQLNTVKDFSTLFDLADLETIDSYGIILSSGLQKISDSNTDDTVSYRLKAVGIGAQTVTIPIVTNQSTPNNAQVKTIHYNVIDNATR